MGLGLGSGLELELGLEPGFGLEALTLALSLKLPLFKDLREEREQQQSILAQYELRNFELEKRNMELCWQQVEWKTNLEALQEES